MTTVYIRPRDSAWWISAAAVLLFAIALATWQPRPQCTPPFAWLPERDVVRLGLERPLRTYSVYPGGDIVFEVQCDELASARRFAWHF